MKAYEYCKNAATTMEQRGKENGYDNAKEERSAKQIAAVFNALTGRDLTEQEAWTFLICLVAYAALLGESYMTVHDEIQVDTSAEQFESLKGWPIKIKATNFNAANFGVVAQDVQPMVVLTGEDGSKILMTPEDFRNMEKTLVRSALK